MSANKQKTPLAAYRNRPIDDEDNPEWTEEDFKRAKPASELPPEVLAAFPKMRGRPPKPPEERKVAISIRLHPMVLDHYKAGGPGWQTRMEKVLIDNAFDEAARSQDAEHEAAPAEHSSKAERTRKRLRRRYAAQTAKPIRTKTPSRKPSVKKGSSSGRSKA